MFEIVTNDFDLWFTADTHFNHKYFLDFDIRPFDSIVEMDSALISCWNQVINPEDYIIILGDFCFMDKNYCKNILERLNGFKIFCYGDYDHVVDDPLDIGFDDLVHQGPIRINDFIINVSHFPYHSEGLVDIFDESPEFYLQDDGNWLLHGHVHNLWHINKRQINVGVTQNDYFPVSWDKILEIINEGGKK